MLIFNFNNYKRDDDPPSCFGIILFVLSALLVSYLIVQIIS